MLALVVGIGVGAAITGVVATRGDDGHNASSTAQLSQVQSSCRDWMSSSKGEDPGDAWCTDMFSWMGDQSGGSMMWQGSEQMGTACRDWVDQDRSGSGQTDQKRCNDMVEWMDQHMSSRGGHWMMQDR